MFLLNWLLENQSKSLFKFHSYTSENLKELMTKLIDLMKDFFYEISKWSQNRYHENGM